MGKCKIVYNDEVLIDLSQDSVTPETLDEGVTAHDKDGNPIVGTRTPEEPVTEELNVTANGTYEPEDGVDGFHKIVVDVPSEEPVLQEKRVTPKDTPQYVEPDDGYDGLSKVAVGAIPSAFIRPTGTLAITENSTTVDVSEYEKVNVSIPMGYRRITENGTYTARDSGWEGFSSVSVEVPVSSGSTVSVRAGSSVNGYSLYFIAPNGYKGVLSSGQIADTVGGIVIQSSTTKLSTSGLIFSTVVGNCRVYYFGEGGYFR